MRAHRRPAGFTLVEVLTVLAVAAVLAGVALPAYRHELNKARRSDAVAALTRVQMAQERLRASQGLYSDDFGTLKVTDRSNEGLYTLAVQLTGPDSYRAVATVAAGTAQAGDRECPQLALQVSGGFAQIEPSARCWNR
jgi:type IV pilus assembly protein PilE